jgi:outer membrane protein TolC
MTLKDAIAQLRSARAQILVSEGAFFPTCGTTTSYSRQALQVTLRKDSECHYANAAVPGG